LKVRTDGVLHGIPLARFEPVLVTR
jgi:hypothetical protein